MDERRIEEVGMLLARRAYVYRILHIALGAEPGPEEVALLASDETRDAFAGMGVPALTQAAEAFAALGAGDPAIEDAKLEFERLFMVPGVGYVRAWESSYVGNENMMFQRSTLDVKRRYDDWGYALDRSGGRYPEDHVALMLGFLAYAAGRTFEAFADGDDERVGRYLASQRAFSEAHMGPWLDDFAAAVEKGDRTGLYAACARAAAALAPADRAALAALQEDFPLSE